MLINHSHKKISKVSAGLCV